MKELKSIKIIAVDHGYGNIKTANTVTPTGITAYDTEPIFSGNILEYNGTYYRIGEGHKEFIPDKAMDEDYYLLTLMAVARELNAYGIREADVHLAAGLPLTWVRKQREDFRTYLLRNEYVSFHFNGKEYKLHFVGCSLFPQGYPAIVSRLGDFKGTNLLIQSHTPCSVNGGHLQHLLRRQIIIIIHGAAEDHLRPFHGVEHVKTGCEHGTVRCQGHRHS